MNQRDFEAAVAAEVAKRLRMAVNKLQQLRQSTTVSGAGDACLLARQVMDALEEAAGPAPSGDVNRQLVATQTLVPTCSICGGKLGGYWYTRKRDGALFCSSCAEEEYPNLCVSPDFTPPRPPSAPLQPPRSRCCNADVFDCDGRVACQRCRLGCRTR